MVNSDRPAVNRLVAIGRTDHTRRSRRRRPRRAAWRRADAAGRQRPVPGAVHPAVAIRLGDLVEDVGTEGRQRGADDRPQQRRRIDVPAGAEHVSDRRGEDDQGREARLRELQIDRTETRQEGELTAEAVSTAVSCGLFTVSSRCCDLRSWRRTTRSITRDRWRLLRREVTMVFVGNAAEMRWFRVCRLRSAGTVTMWAIAYVGRLPAVLAPSWSDRLHDAGGGRRLDVVGRPAGRDRLAARSVVGAWWPSSTC